MRRTVPTHPTLAARALSAALAAGMILFAGTAHARPTPEQKCQAGKNIAAGKFAACLQNAEAKLATTGDQGGLRRAFS